MIASEVVQEGVQIPLATESLSEERMAYLERLVSQARTAAAVFTQFTQEDVDRIVKPMVLAGLEQAQHLARLAVEETKLGVIEDKVLKNMNVPVTPEGGLTFEDGISAPGRYVEMRAEMDVLALISNCPQLNNPCNAYNPTPVRLLIWE